MSSTLVVYPHGLGDCILLTPALRDYFEITGEKLSLAIQHRFKSSEIFKNCPYVDDVFYTKDPWNDFPNEKLGFQSVYESMLNAGKDTVIMPMHDQQKSKILINYKYLSIEPKNTHTEVYISDEDRKIADTLIYMIAESEPYGFIHSKTGVTQKDLPDGYGKMWLNDTKGLNKFIEVGETFDAFKYSINVQFELLRRASGVCVADSVFYHAAGALDKQVDLAYFARGQKVYDRVKPLHQVNQNISYKL